MKGLFYGDASQFAAQCIGTLTCFVWVAITFFIVMKVLDALVGNRVSPKTEIEGLDIPEMGVAGYVGVKLDKFSETPLSTLPGKTGPGPKSA